MGNEEKLTVVREFLKSEFPGCAVEDSFDPETDSRHFRIVYAGSTYEAFVSTDFLGCCEPTEISGRLKGFTLVEHLRDLPATPLFVTSTGLKILYE